MDYNIYYRESSSNYVIFHIILESLYFEFNNNLSRGLENNIASHVYKISKKISNYYNFKFQIILKVYNIQVK